MSAIARLTVPRAIVRVLACAATPIDPGEIHEVAVADVMVDGEGARLEALSVKSFTVIDVDGGTTCTPMHLATAVWGGRSPDVLAAHDAATASLTFGHSLTRGLPWISIHKVARRVWPGQDSYDAHSLARWRDWAGPNGPYSSHLPSGAQRDAALSAGLLVELLRDPALRNVAEGILLERAERGGCGIDAGCLCAMGGLDAAMLASTLPSKPLREAPYPFDDQREWVGVSLEDVRYYARFSACELTAEAARSELESRSAGSLRRP